MGSVLYGEMLDEGSFFCEGAMCVAPTLEDVAMLFLVLPPLFLVEECHIAGGAISGSALIGLEIREYVLSVSISGYSGIWLRIAHFHARSPALI
jgi:hypothetical protein